MKHKLLASALTVALLSLATPQVEARDLVKATAALVLVEEPPLTRSQVLEKQRQEAEAAAAVEQKKEIADTPYYKRWWFWALSAAVVGGTVALGFMAVDSSPQPAKSCAPGVLACFGDGRGTVR